jgi:hypothetical protein
MRTIQIAVPLFLLATAAACEVVGEDDADLDEIEATTTATPIAQVITDDGGVWRFLEAEPGELFLWTTLPESSRIGIDRLVADEPTYVDLYRRLTTAPVPRTLLDAQARADALLGESDPDPDQSGLVNEEGGQATTGGKLTQAISATDFQNSYCLGSWDYMYCWPSFYGSPYVQRKTYSLWGYVAAVNNTVDFRLRYKKHSTSSWSTLISAQALPGQVHWVHTSYWGYRRWRRWEVLDNGANLVRYSVYGSD